MLRILHKSHHGSCAHYHYLTRVMSHKMTCPVNDVFRDRWGYPAGLLLILLRQQPDVLGMWPADERSLPCEPASPACGSVSVLVGHSVSSSGENCLCGISLNCWLVQAFTPRCLTWPGWSRAPRYIACQESGRKAQVTGHLLSKLLLF